MLLPDFDFEPFLEVQVLHGFSKEQSTLPTAITRQFPSSPGNCLENLPGYAHHYVVASSTGERARAQGKLDSLSSICFVEMMRGPLLRLSNMLNILHFGFDETKSNAEIAFIGRHIQKLRRYLTHSFGSETMMIILFAFRDSYSEDRPNSHQENLYFEAVSMQQCTVYRSMRQKFPGSLKDSLFSVTRSRGTFHNIKQYFNDYYRDLLPTTQLCIWAF